MSDLEQIRNYVQLLDRVATSGQPEAHQFKLISREGYTTVINLAMPDHPDSIPNEGEIVTELGMTYVHLPVPFDAPLRAHVRKFCLLLDSVGEEQVWVHCIMNYRVSAFMWHYLTSVVGMDELEARSPMFDHWKPDDVWAELINWSPREIGLGNSREP